MKAIILFISCFICTASLANENLIQQPSLVGNAYNPSTDELLYQEQHFYKFVNGQKTLSTTFNDAQGNKIAERIVKYQNQSVKSYRLEQHNIDYAESIIYQNNLLKFEGLTDGDIDQENIATDKEIVIDAGFSDFIVQNWDELVDGQTIKFNFASIGLMKTVKLQLKKTDLKRTSAKEKFNDQEVTMFKMTLANPILKMLVKPIEVGFYNENRQLAYYKGISNIKNDNGERFPSVRIEYVKLPTHQDLAATEY